MADKYGPLVVAALTKAAATPSGTILYGPKTAPGLFPNTLAGRTAAARALSDGYLTVTRTGTKSGDVYVPTEKGLRHLLDQSNPKTVLEDLVRGLEFRQNQVDELLNVVRGMTSELAAMKATVEATLPVVVGARTTVTHGRAITRDPALSGAILHRLGDWTATAGSGQDCPLSDLYRSLTVCDDLTVGLFHDGLRALHAEKKIYLHPWTGPLYAMPEPTFALLIGHEIAYYASLSGQWSIARCPKPMAVSGH